MKERPPPLVVLLVCGGDGVGKTALLNRLTSDMFISDSATLGPGLDIRNHRLGSVARLQLWEVGMCDSARAEACLAGSGERHMNIAVALTRRRGAVRGW